MTRSTSAPVAIKRKNHMNKKRYTYGKDHTLNVWVVRDNWMPRNLDGHIKFKSPRAASARSRCKAMNKEREAQETA